jgi:hypothetical protein
MTIALLMPTNTSATKNVSIAWSKQCIHNLLVRKSNLDPLFESLACNAKSAIACLHVSKKKNSKLVI